MEEFLNTIENINLPFFEQVDDKLLPSGQGEKKEKREEGVVERPKIRHLQEELIDPKRIDFMVNQPRVLFGIVGINSGFKGYYGFVFPKFVVF